MLDVRVYDTEKNTWNININGKEHEIRIDVWRDIYVDDEKVGAVRELTEREWNGEKYVWRLFIPVDGVRVEHRYYEWENPNETKVRATFE